MAAIQDYLGNVLKGTANGDGTFSISGGSGGGGAVTVADGADVTQGSIADAGVKDAAGTINAHLRGLIEVMLGGAVAVGPSAAGAAASGNPVLIAGEDATTAVRTVATDASGNVQVVGPKIQGTSTTFAPQVVAGTSAAGQTGTVQALVVSTAGAAKVDGSAVTQPVSGTVTLGAGSAAVGTVVASINDGTTLANNVATPDTGQGAQLVAGNRKEVSFTTTTVQAVAAVDSSNYREVSVQIVSQGTTSTVSFQGSNDNSTWVSFSLLSSIANGSTSTTTPTVSTTTTGIFFGGLPFRYFRLNVTGISGGTTAGVVELFSGPAPPIISSVLAVISGIPPVSLAATTTGGYSYTHISTATTTTAKSGAGTLHTLVVGTGQTAATATIYDSLTGSGTVISVVDISTRSTLTFDLAFATGLTIVTAGATPADVTVMYK